MKDRRTAVGGPLACCAESFGTALVSLGYDQRRAAVHLDLLASLSEWLGEVGLAASELTEPRMAQFLEVRRGRGWRDLVTSRGVALMLEHLRGLGVVPPVSRPVPDGPAAESLERYGDYLASERGLSEREVARYLVEVAPFVGQLAGPAGIDWDTVSAADVTRFVVEVSSGRGRAPSSKLLAALRSFLRFAQLEGWISRPLAQAVPSAPRWTDASLPRGIERDEVRRLLDSCDRNGAAGRRDYAILTLLVRLGLRAAEVARMQLEDVDWRAGELLVHGKGPREENMPLPVDVGQALVDYLRHGRPDTTSRAVFLRRQVPLRGLGSIGVTSVVYRACERAGVTRVGAHRLRHTAATEMLRAGASLGEVGQALRQRSPSSTAIYAKVDHIALRALARPWPGGAA